LIRNFSKSSHVEIPSDIEILGSSCFSSCQSLSSVSFHYLSRVKGIKSLAFDGLNLMIVIRSTVLFIAFDGIPKRVRIFIGDCDSYREFHRWQQLHESGIDLDFRGILRVDHEFHGLSDYLVDVLVFETGSMLGELDRIWSNKYVRSGDHSSVIVKSMGYYQSIAQLRNEIENQLNLCHPCILGPIGFIFRTDLAVSQELKIVKFYSEGNSLTEVISMNPEE
jgi:hypothetical protein